MARRRAVLIIALIAFGALMALSLLMVGSAQAKAALPQAISDIPLPALQAGSALGSDLLDNGALSIAAIPPAQNILTCTTTITTPNSDVNVLNNNSIAAAAASNVNLLPYGNLSLMIPATPPGVSVTVYTQYFRLDAVANFHYIVSAQPNTSSSYNLGFNIYNPGGTRIFTGTKPLSDLGFTVDYVPTQSGVIYFAIFHQGSNCPPSGTYQLDVDGPLANTPTPTGSPTISPTPSPTVNITALPGADRFEPNFNFDSATTIGLGEEYTNLNFVPWFGADPFSRDDDWFRVWVKPGFLVTCETFDLSPQADTNIVLFDNNRNGLGGNDDIDRAVGNLGSRVVYYATYEGYLYVDIGQLFAVRPNEAHLYTYSLRCYRGSGPTATPSNTFPPVTPRPTNTPTIPTETPIPTPTWTPTPTPPFIQVRPLPTATPIGQVLYNIPILLTVYYDRNDNRTPDPGEGVAGISARVLDVTNGVELQHAFTDEFGFASLTVTAPGVVRFVVPYLNHSVVVQPSGYSVALRIPPYDIPDIIP
jgi:hypothetical protein